MVLSVAQTDYAFNPQVLRAVLNGYAIDMTVPCTEYQHKQMQGWNNERREQAHRNRSSGAHGDRHRQETIGELPSTTDCESSMSDESSEGEGEEDIPTTTPATSRNQNNTTKSQNNIRRKTGAKKR